VDVAGRLIDRMNFPWLLTNVFDGLTGESIANTVTYKLLHFKGVVIGLIGLAEAEWIDTLPKLPDHGKGLKYLDFVSEGRRMAQYLRNECGAHVVIALTHMREPNDVRLAAEVPDIDLILGGHDHLYAVHHVPYTPADGTVAVAEKDLSARSTGGLVVKSGTDFRNITLIRCFLKRSLEDALVPDTVPATPFGTQPANNESCAVLHGPHVAMVTGTASYAGRYNRVDAVGLSDTQVHSTLVVYRLTLL